MTSNGSQTDRSLVDLFADATRESSELLRKEVELAKLEISENVAALKTGVASMAIAVPLLFAGFLVLLGAAVLGLDLVLHRLWLSALLVGGSVVGIGLIAFFGGRAAVIDKEVAPEQTIESLRDDKAMIEQHV